MLLLLFILKYLSFFDNYFRCKGKFFFYNYQIKTRKNYRKTIIFSRTRDLIPKMTQKDAATP